MRILIYGRFSSHHFAIRNVITSICAGLNRKYDFEHNQIIVLTNMKNEEVFSSMKNLTIDTINIEPDNAWKNQFYTLFKLPKYIRKNKIDLVIFPQITFYYFKKCRTIFYLHDLIEYQVKNQKSFSLGLRKCFYKRAAKISDQIITVSNNSKEDIHNILHYPLEKITVLYDGRDEDLVPQKKDISLKKIQEKYPRLQNIEKYVLYVGYLAHPQKNILFVLDNISDILLQYNLYFILVGPDGKDAELIHNKIREINNKIGNERIISLGSVDKDLLPYFYSGADSFIFVSLYEGFGMPVLEAMSCGCPVITSDRSSLKEIADGYAKLVNPYDAEQFKQNFVELLSEDRKDISFYKEPLKKYTWDKHIDGLINVIKRITL